MAAINPITLARVNGKEPLFSIIFVIIVVAVAYGVNTTGPTYLKRQRIRLDAMQKEINEKMKSAEIEQYKASFKKNYEPFIASVEAERFKSAASVMDDVRQQVNRHGLRLISMSRSTKETSSATAQLTGISFVYIKMMFEGELSDVLTFIRDFAEAGPFRRVMTLDASSPPSSMKDKQTKYNLILVLPSLDSR